MYPEFNLDFYKPSEAIVKKVAKSMAKQKEDKILLRPIFEDLNEEVSYEEIKTALIFLNRKKK